MAIAIFVFCFWQIKVRGSKTPIQNNETVQQISASLKISNGKTIKSFDISSFVGKTALETTRNKANIVVKGDGTNTFITSIDDRIADSNKHEFWELDANGNETPVGAGSYIIKNHDKIEWKINNY